jgi:hypothetical protein
LDEKELSKEFYGTEVAKIIKHFQKKESKAMFLGNMYDGLAMAKESSNELFPCVVQFFNLKKGILK